MSNVCGASIIEEIVAEVTASGACGDPFVQSALGEVAVVVDCRSYDINQYFTCKTVARTYPSEA